MKKSLLTLLALSLITGQNPSLTSYAQTTLQAPKGVSDSKRTAVVSSYEAEISALQEAVRAAVAKKVFPATVANAETKQERHQLVFARNSKDVSDAEYVAILKLLEKGFTSFLSSKHLVDVTTIEVVKDAQGKLTLENIGTAANPQAKKIRVPLTITSIEVLGEALEAKTLLTVLKALGFGEKITIDSVYQVIQKLVTASIEKEKALVRQTIKDQDQALTQSVRTVKEAPGQWINSGVQKSAEQKTALELGYHPSRLIVVADHEEDQIFHPAVKSVRKLRSHDRARHALVSAPEDGQTQQKIQSLPKDKQPRKVETANRIDYLKAELKKNNLSSAVRSRLQSNLNAYENKNELVQRARVVRAATNVVEIKDGHKVEDVVKQLKEAGYRAELDYVVTAEGQKKSKSDSQSKPRNLELDNLRIVKQNDRQARQNYTRGLSKKQIWESGHKKDEPGQYAAGTSGEGFGVGFFPSDGLLFDQWYLGYPYGVNAEAAWAFWGTAYFSPSIVVAVVDSGIEYAHPDFYDIFGLQTNIVDGYDFVENNFIAEDEDGHGTMVAGIIAAVPDNDFLLCKSSFGNYDDCTIAGVASNQNTLIMPVRNLDAFGNGFTSDSIDAFYFAVDNGAWIINASFKSAGFSQALKDAINYADYYGVPVVSSAGNNGKNTDLGPNFHYPSGYNTTNILSVGSINQTGNETSFSSYGECTVDFFTPGTDILSTYFYEPGELYPWHDSYDGTSFSAPIATAVLANIMVRFPFLTVPELMFSMRSGTTFDARYINRNLAEGRLDMDFAMTVAHSVNNGSLAIFDIGPFQCPNGAHADFYVAPPSSGGGSAGGGCFIATAAYGTAMHEDINWLRIFRDRFLMSNSIGQSFVKMYYTYSPAYADQLAKNETGKSIVRKILMPIVGYAKLMVQAPLTTMSISIVFLMGMFLLLTRMVIIRRRKF
jgi:subtilisin family serine protease